MTLMTTMIKPGTRLRPSSVRWRALIIGVRILQRTRRLLRGPHIGDCGKGVAGKGTMCIWDNSSIDLPTNHPPSDLRFSSRLTRHLYGKQTDDGRFIFGGDRIPHPEHRPGLIHPLPRLPGLPPGTAWGKQERE